MAGNGAPPRFFEDQLTVQASHYQNHFAQVRHYFFDAACISLHVRQLVSGDSSLWLLSVSALYHEQNCRSLQAGVLYRQRQLQDYWGRQAWTQTDSLFHIFGWLSSWLHHYSEFYWMLETRVITFLSCNSRRIALPGVRTAKFLIIVRGSSDTMACSFVNVECKIV